MSHRNAQLLALGAMILLLLLYSLTQLGFFGPNQIGQTSTSTAPLLIPAGYAFSIWGPIYLGLIAFPIYQLVKKRDNHPAWIPLRLWYAGNVVANGLWLAAASYDWLILSVGIIVFMLISLFRINVLLRRIAADRATHSYWLEQLVFKLYFAWITLATVLNVTAALYFYEWSGFGFTDKSWTIIMIVVAAIVAGITAFRFRDPVYCGVVSWAFLALTLRHWENLPVLAYIALAVVVLFVLLGGTLLRQPPPVLAT